LQVNAVAVDTLIPDEVGALLQRGLEALTTGRPEAARASGLTIGQVDSALAWLRTHLRADLLERDEPACAPTPVDVIVRLSAVGFVIETVAGPWSAVRVAPAYLALADDPRVRPDLLRATRFVEVLGRRDNILTLVCAAILHRQSAWISSGHSGLRPLSRREVAAELGVHESTISRAVAGKHMLLPSGATTTLATFFGADDGARECLREIVAGESAPRSDADLARALAVRGHVVARRTIAKYRAELGIPRLRNRGGEHDAKPHPTIR
jgi:RNA polymerase sigma-54 factor